MLNHVAIQGRLTADPELRRTQSGTSVCTFRLAWSEKIKETENKLFIDCVTWRGTAEFVSKHFSKGQEILAEGKLNTRTWQDKDGNNRSIIELVADTVHFCGPKSDKRTEQSEDAPPIQSDTGFSDLTDNDGDLPF